jgi:hypothetical protein
VVTKYFAETPLDFASAESGLLEVASDFELSVSVFEAEGQVPEVYQDLMVRFGKPSRGLSATRIPISWEPQGSSQRFPTLTGELELAALAGNCSRLSLSVDYARATEAAGGADNQGLTYRASWVTLNDIEARIATFLSRLIRERGPVSGSDGPLPLLPRRVA